MTIFGGMIGYATPGGLDKDACRALGNAISRVADDPRETFADEQCCLVKVDIGAYGEPAYHRGADGTVGMLVGEPLLAEGEAADRPDRGADLRRLHESWLAGDYGVLKRAHGTFAAAHYDPKRKRLAITADKLGVRPVYWWNGPGIIVFASALRILEALDFVPKVMDLRGTAETIAFGFPLGRRTQYRAIFCLDAGEILEVTKDGPRSETYWRWDRLDEQSLAPDVAVRELHKTFGRAIARRLRPDETSAICFLSAGLDSRCIATELVGRGKTVHSFNISWLGTYDKVLSTDYAERLGARHHQSHMKITANTHPVAYLGQAVSGAVSNPAFRPERPRMVFSGDGGSVGLGHVYMNREMVEDLRAGRPGSAVCSFIRYNKVELPLRFMSARARRVLLATVSDGITDELSRFECNDRGRNIHVFLLLNDQRRHLAAHFENIDTVRFEMHLPFFDSGVLEAVYRTPLDELLRHRFYYKWLEEFPKVVTSVPWQSYPNHLPCPLPMPEGYQNQWEYDGVDVGLTKPSDYARQLRAAISDAAFPSRLWSGLRLWLALLMTAWDVRDYSYVLKGALTSHDIARKCDQPSDLYEPV